MRIFRAFFWFLFGSKRPTIVNHLLFLARFCIKPGELGMEPIEHWVYTTTPFHAARWANMELHRHVVGTPNSKSSIYSDTQTNHHGMSSKVANEQMIFHDVFLDRGCDAGLLLTKLETLDVNNRPVKPQKECISVLRGHRKDVSQRPWGWEIFFSRPLWGIQSRCYKALQTNVWCLVGCTHNMVY